VLLIIGDLMDNDLIVGPEMEDRLLGIWVEIRNLVNIGFVLVLLVIAFYNALPFTESEGNLAIKTALPKLIIGLILVNFTFVGSRVVLDLANIGTTAAFALPEIVEDFDFTSQKTEFIDKVCWNNTGSTRTEWTKADDDEGKTPINAQIFCQFDDESETYINPDIGTPDLTGYMAATYFQDLNKSNISIIMAVNAGALESLSLLNPEAITDISDLVANSLFSLIMYLVFAITYIVLAIVLITRIAVMWVAIAFSPVAVLFFVVPQLKDALGSGGGDIVGKVTKNLLAPIIIGLTMTVGYLMISAIGDVGSISTDFANFKVDDLLETQYYSSGIHDMEKLIIAIASIVIVWLGVFAAAEGTIAESVTSGIKDLAMKAGKAAGSAPFFAPILPVFGKDNSSVNTSPLALFGLAKQELNRFDSGYYAQEGIDNLRTSMGFGGSNGADAPAPVARENIFESLQDRSEPESLSKYEAKEIANGLMSTVRGNQDLDAGRRDEIITRINSAKEKIDRNDISGLKEIFSGDDIQLDELNLGNRANSIFTDIQEVSSIRPDEKKEKKDEKDTTSPTTPAAKDRAAADSIRTPVAPVARPVASLTTLSDPIKAELATHGVSEIPQGSTAEAIGKIPTDGGSTLGVEMKDSIDAITTAVAAPAVTTPTDPAATTTGETPTAE
jgi:hypothetical protein